MKFIPNDEELQLMEKITQHYPHEYALVRLTPTMLKKSIIDAGEPIRKVFKNESIVNYDTLGLGEANKVFKDIILISNEIYTLKCSFYRPETKKGDPRFWIYGLKKHVNENGLIFITTFQGQVIVIPLTPTSFNTELIKDFFKSSQEEIKDELIHLVNELYKKGPVLSVSPDKLNPKDVGDTFERALGILPNSIKTADFKGSIELKAKRKSVKTNDTLFSMVPDWSRSFITSSPSMIQKYGYESNKYDDFIDLYVTVSNKPNNQNLFLEVDEEKNKLSQYHVDANGTKIETCIWHLNELEERLKNKHPATLWMLANDVIIDDKFHFHYNEAVFTHTPIFASFLVLISRGIVTYDWRGRVKKDGSGYKDKGHCFRIKPKYRNLLFKSTEIIDF